MNPRFRFMLRKNTKAFTKTKTLTKTKYIYKTDSSAKSSNRKSVFSLFWIFRTSMTSGCTTTEWRRLLRGSPWSRWRSPWTPATLALHWCSGAWFSWFVVCLFSVWLFVACLWSRWRYPWTLDTSIPSTAVVLFVWLFVYLFLSFCCLFVSYFFSMFLCLSVFIFLCLFVCLCGLVIRCLKTTCCCWVLPYSPERRSSTRSTPSSTRSTWNVAESLRATSTSWWSARVSLVLEGSLSSESFSLPVALVYLLLERSARAWGGISSWLSWSSWH